MWEYEPSSVICNPHKVIRSLYEGKDLKQDIGVHKYFRTFVEKYANEIPNLTGPESINRLTPNTLVRVVGMVQNQLANDYCLGSYDILDENTGNVRSSEVGLWQEEAVSAPDGCTQRVDESLLVARRSVYIIQIPNLSHWIHHEKTAPKKGFKSPCDCIVRLYFDLGKDIAVNAAVEFIGIWTPATNVRPHILNCLYADELQSGYPLCPSLTMSPAAWDKEMASIKPHLHIIRKEILEMISKALCGDKLTATYVFLHMMSSVSRTRRIEGVILGYFVLNLTGCPESKADDDESFAAGLERLYQWFLPKVNLCHLDRQTMNNNRWVPVKNHETDELSYGLLQNTSDTFLLVNETALSDGKLERNGVPNLRSLVNLVADQKIDFDFVYHTLSFDTSMPTILMSNGKSMVKSDAMVEIKLDNRSQGEISKLMEMFCNINEVSTRGPTYIDSLFANVDPNKLTRWRKYFLLCRQINEKGLDMDKSCSELAQRCFVATRRKNPGFTEGDFHYQLNIARTITMSYGESTMTIPRYNEMRGLEEDRNEGLPERRKPGNRKSQAFTRVQPGGGALPVIKEVEMEN